MILRSFAVVAGAMLIASTPAPPVSGTFALQGAAASTAGYLVAPQIAGDSLYRHLDIWMTPIGSAAAIRSYRVDMTKLLHTIIVSDDFRTFLHVHPIRQAAGHFVLDQEFPRAGLYHIYADAEPSGFGHQVFRFDLQLDDSAKGPRDLSERGTLAKAGPYVVRISTDRLSAHEPTTLVVHVLKNGMPATDLHPYLGANAHAVFLNAGDLSYVHVHPMPLARPPSVSGTSSPNMLLDVELHEPGTYKLWLQFRGGSRLYVASFVLSTGP